VKHKVDETSSDLWAKTVGWYTADIDGKECLFSLLYEALKAYDEVASPSSLNHPDEVIKNEKLKLRRLGRE